MADKLLVLVNKCRARQASDAVAVGYCVTALPLTQARLETRRDETRAAAATRSGRDQLEPGTTRVRQGQVCDRLYLLKLSHTVIASILLQVVARLREGAASSRVA